jgi:hypothetical protein
MPGALDTHTLTDVVLSKFKLKEMIKIKKIGSRRKVISYPRDYPGISISPKEEPFHFREGKFLLGYQT